jgi:hypothetical protein
MRVILGIVADPDPSDRQAYLEEQIERQKRGEPIDVDWARAELERIRREQAARIAATQRNLRWLVIAAAALMLVLWVKQSALPGGRGMFGLALAVLGLLTAVTLGRRRR